MFGGGRKIVLFILFAVFLSVSFSLNSMVASASANPNTSILFDYSSVDFLTKRIYELKALLTDLQKQLVILLTSKKSTPAETFGVRQIADNEIKIDASGFQEEDEYYNKVLKSLSSIMFSEGEREAMKKIKGGDGVVALEEIAQKMADGDDRGELKQIAAAWKNMDEKSLQVIKDISVNQKISATHKKMVAWYEYHGKFAEKLAAADITKEQVKNLLNQYAANARTRAPNAGIQLGYGYNYKNALSRFLDLFVNWIPKTYAAVMPFYHFGGKILFSAPSAVPFVPPYCVNGIYYTIAVPRGGSFLIYYPILAINPYLNKMTSQGINMLGRASVDPPICIVCAPYCVSFPLYSSFDVLFFGSSLTPVL